MKKTKLLCTVLVVVVIAVFAVLVVKFLTKNTENVSGEKSKTEVTMTPIPTMAPEVKQHGLLENGNIVFRYEEDLELLSTIKDENSEDAKVVVGEIELVKDGQTVFREEEKQADILFAGTVVVPKNIACTELVDIVNSFSYLAYLRYQKEYPETKSEFAMFMGEAESNLFNMEYSEYDHFEYKKLTDAIVWKDKTFTEMLYAEEFVVVIDICFQ